MATTSTTLAGAVSPSDWIVTLAASAALKPGDNIVCQNETMRALVVTPGGGPAIVFRGARGTAGAVHAGGATVTYGAPSDYGPGVGVLSMQALVVETLQGFSENETLPTREKETPPHREKETPHTR